MEYVICKTPWKIKKWGPSGGVGTSLPLPWSHCPNPRWQGDPPHAPSPGHCSSHCSTDWRSLPPMAVLRTEQDFIYDILSMLPTAEELSSYMVLCISSLPLSISKIVLTITFLDEHCLSLPTLTDWSVSLDGWGRHAWEAGVRPSQVGLRGVNEAILTADGERVPMVPGTILVCVGGKNSDNSGSSMCDAVVFSLQLFKTAQLALGPWKQTWGPPCVRGLPSVRKHAGHFSSLFIKCLFIIPLPPPSFWTCITLWVMYN